MKLTVIGAGSTYNPELVEGILDRREELPITRLDLMDIDRERLEVVGGLARRMVAERAPDLEVRFLTDRQEAIAGASFVLTQIRVGGNAARILDEKIPLSMGVIGQETTGPGGFAKALRTIPVMLSIARDIERLAPDAWLINFTNPSGIITQAVNTLTKVKVLGLCNVPINMVHDLAEMLGVEARLVTLEYFGLNHLSFVRRIFVEGRDVSAELAEKMTADMDEREREIYETLGLVANGYLNYYYYRDQVLAKLQAAPKSRGEEVVEVEQALIEQYRDPELRVKPAELSKRGGARYSEAAISLVAALHRDKRETHVVNVQNGATCPDLAPTATMELSAVVGKDGAAPLPVGPLPTPVRGLVQAVKAYEELTVQAGAEGDRRVALQALLAHPLVPSLPVAKQLLAALLEAHRQYLPQFGK